MEDIFQGQALRAELIRLAGARAPAEAILQAGARVPVGAILPAGAAALPEVALSQEEAVHPGAVPREEALRVVVRVHPGQAEADKLKGEPGIPGLL